MLQTINPHAAAIDVGSERLHVAVVNQAVQVFDTFTDSLHALRDYLLSAGVTTVAMEATGVYWLPVYEVLEAARLAPSARNRQEWKFIVVREHATRERLAQAANGMRFVAEAPVLMPLITREIVYRLLMGQQGGRLRHLAVQGSYTPHIARAVARLRRDFDQPLRIEQMAGELGMSVSGFHHHFKAVTAMSPLQFQKQLRLQEARRLMLSEDLDAASDAFRVGYRDASHFNREYKGLFGVPPMRDVQRLREEALDSAG